jgi:hypothetical protein
MMTMIFEDKKSFTVKLFSSNTPVRLPCFDAIKHVKLYLLDRFVSVSPIIGAGDIFKQTEIKKRNFLMFPFFVRSLSMYFA